MSEKVHMCPVCRQAVTARHFPCCAGAEGGRARGKCKSRGDSAYYRALRQKVGKKNVDLIKP
jgi:hypothetical protein